MANKTRIQRNQEQMERKIAADHKPDKHYDAEGNFKRVQDAQEQAKKDA